MNEKLWLPGMPIRNANGDVDPSSLGYQYAIQTTTALRGKVIKQKFYAVPPAEYMSVILGTGAWMEEIKTNLTYDVAGDFESGVVNVVASAAQLAQVDTALSPKTAKIITWAKGYQYSVPEVEKALAANNWDVVSSKMEALKRHWDMGIQKVAFLGLKSSLADVPGLLTNPDVDVDTTTITQDISAMTPDDFQAFVSNVLAVYSANANVTALPNMFVMPMADYLGLGRATSPGFPINTKKAYLLQVFRELTQNPNFQIKPLAYADAARNAGFVSAGGTNRYVLYNNDLETLAMDLPVNFTLTPANTGNNFTWQGVGVGQFGGCIVYRPREVIYFDHP